MKYCKKCGDEEIESRFTYCKACLSENQYMQRKIYKKKNKDLCDKTVIRILTTEQLEIRIKNYERKLRLTKEVLMERNINKG